MSTALETQLVEEGFYDEILAVYEEVSAGEKDLANAGSNLIVKLTKLVKENQEMLPDTVQNCLLLILSLFLSHDDAELKTSSLRVV